MQTDIGPDNPLVLSRKWTLRAHGRITIRFADLDWRRFASQA